jgi:predicted protein tyrosine phosphatase
MIVVGVCSRNQVRKTAKRLEASHLLSILDPATRMVPPARIGTAGQLSQVFFDTHDPRQPYAPTLDHMRAISDWTTALPDDTALLIHCVAGVSRSTAVALALAAREIGPGPAAAWLAEIRPEATPNRLIIRLWEELDGWNGQLSSAAKTFPRPIWDEAGDEAA